MKSEDFMIRRMDTDSINSINGVIVKICILH